MPLSPSRTARVLVLTAGYGEGHNAAARAVAAACDEASGPGTAKLVDIFALANPWLDRVVKAGYLTAINRTPRLWGRIYRWLDGNPAVPGLLPLGSALRALDRVIADERPTVVCSTYPAYGLLLDRLARQGRFRAPHHLVVTDSISINSLWWHAPCDGWFVPNEESAEVLVGGGVARAKVRVSGFPVHRFFEDNRGRLSPPDLGSGAAPKVLAIVHSGSRNAETISRLLLAEPGWELTFAVGRDANLRNHLRNLAASRPFPTEILGWTDQIPRLLMTHHALVGKAGGATTQESIAALCPMVISQVVPGQEEGNWELLRRHRVGALATTPDAVISALRRAFAWRGALWRDWRHTLEGMARPAAARTIAAFLTRSDPVSLLAPAPDEDGPRSP